MIKRLAIVASMLALLLTGCTALSGGQSTPTLIVAESKWNLWDPADPDAPALIEAGTNGHHIKSSWQVASVEYMFGWWGLGGHDDGHQLIRHDGSSYRRGNDVVPEEDVQGLVTALDHLYPTQLLLTNQAWTDDYPHWAVEITGSDGQHILLDSSSTGNPGNGPWNVLYNGRLYAHYDATLARLCTK